MFKALFAVTEIVDKSVLHYQEESSWESLRIYAMLPLSTRKVRAVIPSGFFHPWSSHLPVAQSIHLTASPFIHRVRTDIPAVYEYAAIHPPCKRRHAAPANYSRRLPTRIEEPLTRQDRATVLPPFTHRAG